MRFSLFWDVTQRRLLATDVSGQPIHPIFNPLALELDTYIVAHHLCKMLIYYGPKNVTL